METKVAQSVKYGSSSHPVNDSWSSTKLFSGNQPCPNNDNVWESFDPGARRVDSIPTFAEADSMSDRDAYISALSDINDVEVPISVSLIA